MLLKSTNVRIHQSLHIRIRRSVVNYLKKIHILNKPTHCSRNTRLTLVTFTLNYLRVIKIDWPLIDLLIPNLSCSYDWSFPPLIVWGALCIIIQVFWLLSVHHQLWQPHSYSRCSFLGSVLIITSPNLMMSSMSHHVRWRFHFIHRQSHSALAHLNYLFFIISELYLKIHFHCFVVRLSCPQSIVPCIVSYLFNHCQSNNI